MFADIFASHKPKFHSLADVFLRIGASCVLLLDGETVLDKYPADIAPIRPVLIASSKDGLAIHVFGSDPVSYGVANHADDLSWKSWQPVAEMIIELFSNLLKSESDLESLTAALVETQDRLVALYDLSKVTRRTLEIPALLELLASEASRLLKVNSTFVILTQSGQPALIRQHCQKPLPDTQIEVACMLYRRNPQQHTFHDSSTLPVGLRNVMMVSILVRDNVFAALGFFEKTDDFTSPDIKLARALAEQTGAQLENAMLVQDALARTRLETEMSLARQVQMALLPQKLPVLPDIDLYAISSPALEVGGDFFDLLLLARSNASSDVQEGVGFSHEIQDKRPNDSLPDQSLVFLLGDVTGKGLSAALLMSMTRTVARSAARNMPFTAPHQLMKRLNDDMLDDFSIVGMFTTAFIGILNRDTLTLSYCNAGQSPILYVPFKGEPILLEAQDIPIGIFEEYTYSSCTLALSSGDIFIVASDGFPESRDIHGEMFGYERLKEVFASSRQSSAKEIAETLFAITNTFADGHPQDDDRTIIIIKIH